MLIMDYLSRKLPGVTLEGVLAPPDKIAEHVKRTSSRGYRCEDDGCFACRKFPTGGPTARWVKPLGERAVMCPTCLAAVNLVDWWSHGCRAVAKPQDTRHPMGESHRRERVKARKVWTGDTPTTCNYCSVPIRYGFADSPMPGRSSWGILCGLCWNLYGRAPGAYYERRTMRAPFVKREG